MIFLLNEMKVWWFCLMSVKVFHLFIYLRKHTTSNNMSINAGCIHVFCDVSNDWQYVNWLTQEQVIREQDEHLLKFTLLQRLETMETRVQVCPDSQKSPSSYENDVMMHKAHNFEVVPCECGINVELREPSNILFLLLESSFSYLYQSVWSSVS